MKGLLLQGSFARLRFATAAILVLWAAVWWVSRSEPPPLALPPPPAQSGLPAIASGGLVPVAASGQRTPIGGLFDRFDVAAQPIVAPVNASGQVAFYASILRNKATEGLFLARGGQIVKAAAAGDPVPGGGMLSEFAKHPMPALNDAGAIAFGAAITGGRGGEGVFLAKDGGLTAIALAGGDAPGVVGGTFVEFDAPALNNNDEVVFVAIVRHGRETSQVLYLRSDGRLRKLLAEGDPLPGGGKFDKFGLPSINNRGVVAFPASLDHAPDPGGIFVTGTRDLKLLARVGGPAPDGRTMVRFSEHVAIDDDDTIAFGAQLGLGKAAVEAVMTVDTTGLTLVAAGGGDAPGGGRFSGFGPWPAVGPAGRIVFIASVEDGPGPLGIYAGRAGTLSRLASSGGPLGGFAINSVTSASANGGVTFATMDDAAAGGHRIYYLGPERR